MPLVYSAALGKPMTVSDSHERARKIKPQYSEGEPIRVASARNQAEAEFLQGMLLEEGVPSMVRRSAGFDVPDFLAAGPRDILVPESGVTAAREILLEADVVGSDPPAPPVARPARLFAYLVLAVVFFAGLLLVATRVWG
jgi:hypothetical protein